MEKKQFARRMSQLRQAKGVSARDMSLSLGQSAGYINNIENGCESAVHVHVLLHL